MKEIKCIEDVMASGKAFEKGKKYEIPLDISEQDAKTLVSMKRAEWVPVEEVKDEDPPVFVPKDGDYTREELEALKFPEIRIVGDKHNVKDNKKEDLIAKILEAQTSANN